MSTVKRWFRGVTNEEVLSLAKVEQLNPIDHQKLITCLGSYRELEKAKLEDLIKLGLTSHQATSVINRQRDVSAESRLMRKHAISLVTIDDPLYPKLLREISDPPLWLFYRGDLRTCERKTITVVGTRKPSQYAASAVEMLLPSLIIRELVTVSGLAYGTDSLIHRRTLLGNGQTIAVLAGGLDAIYPTDHTQLADEIVSKGGLLLSEYPPGVRPQPYRFPIRNRIVAGLSPLTLIVEAKLKSGTLTTAKSAVDYNRDVWAIPGRITDPSAAGGNFLIRCGALLCAGADQISEYFGLTVSEIERPNLDTPEGQLLHLLTDSAHDLDELMVKTGMNVENILGLVTRLELSGLLYQDGTGRYCIKNHG